MVGKDQATDLSLTKQCKLLGIHRSGLYYKPRGESELNLELMKLMDEQYLKHPHMGANKMHTWLTSDMGYQVSKNRVERLYYRVMGLRATQPGPHTTKKNKAHKVYPYLLRNLTIERPNQAWAMDITYIPMKKGFMYLTAVIDLYSRYVVNWSVSNSMDAEWCQQALQEAVETYGKPEIVNTDQGSQFTSEVFTSYVLQNSIHLSMDGKGRAIDNAFIERLWRSVKYEKLYLYPPNQGTDLYLSLAEYFNYYNTIRRHQGIGKQTPESMYYQENKSNNKKENHYYCRT